ncbi:MAG: adenylate/guanylate cyclase domain-containing protein, partial [Gemmataceae bacterium]|nr:adenylate/guanylate cyclase domain-containing protein [Gemmataceae bacterium]
AERVFEQEGMVVGFTGDGLMAMWGAPSPQPDHADRAVEAARAMLRAVEGFNDGWQSRLPERLRLGIGIHAGKAQVGNVGSRRSPKYGPRGPMVNLASRVEGATKAFGCALLITEATRAALTRPVPCRALGPVRLRHIEGEVVLHEVARRDLESWDEVRRTYEEAFAHFRARNHDEAVGLLGPWLRRYPEDGPAKALRKRAAAAINDGETPHHPVWVLE